MSIPLSALMYKITAIFKAANHLYAGVSYAMLNPNMHQSEGIASSPNVELQPSVEDASNNDASVPKSLVSDTLEGHQLPKAMQASDSEITLARELQPLSNHRPPQQGRMYRRDSYHHKLGFR